MGIFAFLNRSNEELLEECEVNYDRGSGPGGRKADASETMVRVTHPSTGLTASSGKTRSQHKNRKLAVRNLKQNYALNTRHRIQVDTLELPDSLHPYFDSNLRIKKNNPHYPFLVKIVLDVLYTCEGRLGEASEALGVSTNQLTRFLKNDGQLLNRANEIRDRHGYHSVK